MPLITTKDRLQGDIENICEMAKDDIDAALWHFSRAPKLSPEELETAVANICIAIDLLKSHQSED